MQTGYLMSKSKSKKKKKNEKKPDDGSKTISQNRRATHQYEILEKLECGIVLESSEVKSLREGKVSLNEAYVRVRDGELWLIGADIPEYPNANIYNHKPKRPRKLLVHSKQFKKLSDRAHEKGLTLVPLRIYFNARGLVKLMLGVGKGKKLHDKRQDLKNADVKKRIDKIMKGRS